MQHNTGQVVYYNNGGAMMQPPSQSVVVGPQNLQPLGQNVVAGQQNLQPLGQSVVVGQQNLQPPLGQNVAGQQAFQPMGQNFVPQQQYVIISSPMAPTIPTTYPTYKRRASRILGILQISMGILLIGMNIGVAVLDYNIYWIIGAGWWASAFFIVCGSFGIVTGSKPYKCRIITTMVLSIFSCVIVIAVFVQGALGMAYECWYCRDWEGHMAMYGLSIVFGICELAVGVAQSVLCGQALNCASNQVTTFPGFQNGYVNGGFSYMGSQVPVQNIPMEAYGQSVQFAPYSGTMDTTQITGNVQTVNEAQNRTTPTPLMDEATDQTVTAGQNIPAASAPGNAGAAGAPQGNNEAREASNDNPPSYAELERQKGVALGYM